jgi:hydroxymethylpyrimidine pyrophosphatase-like HAD family hydrolase
MRYLALAMDYDGTLTNSGALSSEVAGALERLRASGRRSLLLTGRTFEELVQTGTDLALFDMIVLENGAVLYVPGRRETTLLARGVPVEFTTRLQRLGVVPLIEGQIIVATRVAHAVAVLNAIRELALELQITFNGDAVMVAPSGVNKGSGLASALREMGLSQHEVVGIGNAANDHSFLELCECSVAVHNAVPSLKERVDFCTRAPYGAGVMEVIEELVSTDLAKRSPGGPGDVVVLAKGQDGTDLTFPPYGHNILVTGPSGAGKSTFASGLIERLVGRKYQVCIIDPEGDYGTLDEIVTIGNRLHAPDVEDVISRLRDGGANLVVNLLGIALQDRPAFFAQLMPRLQALRAATGRPHWIVIDEVHHLLPGPWGLVPSTLPKRLGETILITFRPREVAPSILQMVDTAVAVGPSPEEPLAELASALEIPPPRVPTRRGRRHEVVVWSRTAGLDPVLAQTIPARSQRLRHLRKYAEGNLGPKSFVFRGPRNLMNLRAQNLVTFCQIADGVDGETWLFHLKGGHYSEWLRLVIKDDELAREVATIEGQADMPPGDSRRLVREAIDRRYMLPS